MAAVAPVLQLNEEGRQRTVSPCRWLGTGSARRAQAQASFEAFPGSGVGPPGGGGPGDPK